MPSNKFRPGIPDLRELIEIFFLLIDKIIPILLKDVLPNQDLLAVLSFIFMLCLFFLVLPYWYFPQREIFVIHEGYKEANAQYRVGAGTWMASLAVASPSLLLWLKWFKPEVIWLLNLVVPDPLFWFIFTMSSWYAIILFLSHHFDGQLSIIITLWIILSLCSFLLFNLNGFNVLIPYIVLLLFFIIYTFLIKIVLDKEIDTLGREQ